MSSRRPAHTHCSWWMWSQTYSAAFPLPPRNYSIATLKETYLILVRNPPFWLAISCCFTLQSVCLLLHACNDLPTLVVQDKTSFRLFSSKLIFHELLVQGTTVALFILCLCWLLYVNCSRHICHSDYCLLACWVYKLKFYGTFAIPMLVCLCLLVIRCKLIVYDTVVFPMIGFIEKLYLNGTERTISSGYCLLALIVCTAF